MMRLIGSLFCLYGLLMIFFRTHYFFFVHDKAIRDRRHRFHDHAVAIETVVGDGTALKQRETRTIVIYIILTLSGVILMSRGPEEQTLVWPILVLCLGGKIFGWSKVANGQLAGILANPDHPAHSAIKSLLNRSGQQNIEAGNKNLALVGGALLVVGAVWLGWLELAQFNLF